MYLLYLFIKYIIQIKGQINGSSTLSNANKRGNNFLLVKNIYSLKTNSDR